MEGSAGAAPAAATPTQGQGAPSPTQPPAGGQGQGTGQPTAAGQGQQGGSEGFNWGLFPNVPEAQRELLAPHLRGVLGHVTQLEQKWAPYGELASQVEADQVPNLLGFLNGWSNSPLETWLGLAQSLQEQGLVDRSLTPEQLQGLVTGQIQLPPQEGQVPQQGGEERIPMWAQQMQAQLEQYQQAEQQRTLAQQESEQQQLLSDATTQIRTTLTQAGIPETAVNDEMIRAAIIAHNGDLQMAANSFSSLRDGLLKGFTESRTTPGAPTINGGAPQAPRTPSRNGDGFKQQRAGAEQFLRQAAAGAAQE